MYKSGATFRTHVEHKHMLKLPKNGLMLLHGTLNHKTYIH